MAGGSAVMRDQRTRQCYLSARGLIALSRRQIMASRHLKASSVIRLRRFRSIAGGAADVRGEVRRALQEGRLPRVSGRAWVGHGSGKPCVVCQEPIVASDVEYELDQSEPLRAHAGCFRVWREESSSADGLP